MRRLLSFPCLLARLLACLCLLPCLAAVPAHADTVVVTADRMVDVLAGRLVAHPAITIRDGRITAIYITRNPDKLNMGQSICLRPTRR